MMETTYHKYSPCGNTTVFLETVLPPVKRASICSRVMRKDMLDAEQAGLIDCNASPPALTMMGGEFCLNASRAFAFHLALRGRLTMRLDNGVYEGQIASSGLSEPIAVRVIIKGSEDGIATVRIPLDGVTVSNPEDGTRIVRLPGITHILIDDRRHPPFMTSEVWRTTAALLRNRFDLETEPAVGLVRFRQSVGKDNVFAITPYVWVREGDSTCMETSCGSGSLALAYALRGMSESFTIRQPGGDDLAIDFLRFGNRIHAEITGSVISIGHGTINV